MRWRLPNTSSLVVYPKSSHQSSHQSHYDIQNPRQFLKQNCHFKDSLHPLMPVVGSQARQRCYDGRLCCPPRQEEIQSPPGLAGEVVLIISVEKIQIDTEMYRHIISSYEKNIVCFRCVLVCFLSLQKALLLFFDLLFLGCIDLTWVIWSGKAIGQLLVRVWSRRAWCLAALTQIVVMKSLPNSN